jgi:hypothetical protein
MKIGILTFANVPNFGANLQALSTISYLQNHGYNPILIKWEPEDFEARFTSIKTQKQPQEHFHFVEKYFPQTKICRNDDDICQVIKDEKIEGIIQSRGMITKRAYFRQDQAYKACLPLNENSDLLKSATCRNVLSSGLVRNLSFYLFQYF